MSARISTAANRYSDWTNKRRHNHHPAWSRAAHDVGLDYTAGLEAVRATKSRLGNGGKSVINGFFFIKSLRSIGTGGGSFNAPGRDIFHLATVHINTLMMVFVQPKLCAAFQHDETVAAVAA